MQKKIIFWLFWILISLFVFNIQSSVAQVNTDFPYVWVWHEWISDEDKTEAAWILHNDIVDEGQWYIQRLLTVLWLEQFASWTDPQSWNTTWWHNYIIYLFNIWIWISAFIAILFIIYWFAKMFFSKDEEGYTTAMKIVKNSAIAIAIIGLARFVVGFLFYFFNTVNDVNTNDDQQVNITNSNLDQQ